MTETRRCGQCANWKRYKAGESPFGECQVPIPENIPAWASAEGNELYPPLLPTSIHESAAQATECPCFVER